MLLGKMREKQTLLEARTNALKEAESKIQERNKFIADLEIKNIELKAINKSQQELLKRIEKIVVANTYNNEKAILGKIKELVRPGNQN